MYQETHFLRYLRKTIKNKAPLERKLILSFNENGSSSNIIKKSLPRKRTTTKQGQYLWTSFMVLLSNTIYREPTHESLRILKVECLRVGSNHRLLAYQANTLATELLRLLTIYISCYGKL